MSLNRTAILLSSALLALVVAPADARDTRQHYDIAQAELKLEELAEVRERCREAAVARSKERKLLDKLKTKKAARHVIEQNIAEQNENDEMASVRYQPPAY